MPSFTNPTTERFDATLLADYIAHEPSKLGRDFAGDLYEYRDGVYVRDSTVVTRRCAKALGASYTKNVESQAAAHLLNIDLPEVGLPELPRGYLDHIVLENGVYWWREDRLTPHTEMLGALTKLPITHDAIALPHEFRAWLRVVFGDDEDMLRHVWEVLGYLLMTGNPLQKIILLYGGGGDGKGTFLRLLRAMLGKVNYSSVSLHQLVEDRFASSNLYGKTANISGDLSSKFLSDPQILKEITGGDSISASRKHGQAFEFVPYAVPIFAANEFFRTSDSSYGWRRRWMVIEFPNKVENDTEGAPVFDESVLHDDIPGIFNEAMEGLRRLMARGRFAAPDAAREATTRMHDEADPFMVWLDEDENVELDAETSSSCSDVYKAYTRWCRANGVAALSAITFGQRLRPLGITKIRPRIAGGRVQHYQGIRVYVPAGVEA
ncbi:phage/plasmid primase, P4 family [Microbacterium sp. KSW4-16]|uniref:DNA primase family protein n=1 Tax=Microbacterium aurugineum TaxID=2851642 RepID=UPI0020BEB878|nr:phage/plasmid primase, P4 family [Microbacterium aurugineum]MCK8465860.1 phage/plasmid primase, P4 family [Microbacterium aurugineum]